ncbi:MAG: pseudoazurin [Paucimonas sp.]|jgi:pseudoazurin|nr:pseudoazurin [Paucimonas sp.]
MRALPRLALLAMLFSPAALAEVHEVKMLNRGASGAMVYEPDYLHLQPGDSVRFLPTQSGHNAATLDGLLPAGAEPFKGKINQALEVKFEVPGFYGIQCSPHVSMGMVMLIQVGEAATPAVPDGLNPRAGERLAKIIERELTSR